AISTAVDKKGWRHLHAALARAGDVFAHAGLSRRKGRLVVLVVLQVKVARNFTEGSLRENRSTLHQGFVNVPEIPRGLGCVFRQLRSAHRILAALNRRMSKHVSHAIPEPAAQVLDDFVNGMTARAGIA